MKLIEIQKYLNELYSLNLFQESDSSISKRFSLFPLSAYSSFEKDFIMKSNGLLLNNGEEVRNVVFACFLSDFLWESLRELDLWDTMIITHHIYDVDAGEPGLYVAKGFSTISIDFFGWLRERRISVYALHLPLDMNEQLINNHDAFCEKLCVKRKKYLFDLGHYTMGYIGEISHNDYLMISKMFKQVVIYGNDLAPRKNYKVAVLAGMLSSVDMLKEISIHDIDILICGDVLLRDGSNRMKKIEQYIFEECPFMIICVSHQWSEEIGLLELMKYLENTFEEARFLFISGEDRWK